MDDRLNGVRGVQRRYAVPLLVVDRSEASRAALAGIEHVPVELASMDAVEQFALGQLGEIGRFETNQNAVCQAVISLGNAASTSRTTACGLPSRN